MLRARDGRRRRPVVLCAHTLGLSSDRPQVPNDILSWPKICPIRKFEIFSLSVLPDQCEIITIISPPPPLATATQHYPGPAFDSAACVNIVKRSLNRSSGNKRPTNKSDQCVPLVYVCACRADPGNYEPKFDFESLSSDDDELWPWLEPTTLFVVGRASSQTVKNFENFPRPGPRPYAVLACCPSIGAG